MNRSTHELAAIVEELLRLKAEARRRKILAERGDIHEADISLDPSTFKVVSKSTTDDGDTLIEWQAVEYVLTEFTISEPYRFEKSGRLLLKKNGAAELL
ncbi:MAG: hypothetical protein ACXAEF_04590 [Candidatus Thorarchaeota archaeon]